MKNLYVLLSISGAFVARVACAADSTPPSRTSLELACIAYQARPSKDDCAGRLSIETESPTWVERFRLSLNDPIESFSYAGRYIGRYGLFLRPPAIGGLRDRFIDTDPFGSTLLFTTVVVGGGIDVAWGPLRLVTSASGVYVKQRFAPNALHSDEALDPEAESTFGFAQFGGLSEASLVFKTSQVEMEVWASRVDITRDATRLQDEELAWKARLVVVRWRSGAMGMSAERYWRWQTLRRDNGMEHNAVSRAGVYLEF